jgi:hypothetical protein
MCLCISILSVFLVSLLHYSVWLWIVVHALSQCLPVCLHNISVRAVSVILVFLHVRTLLHSFACIWNLSTCFVYLFRLSTPVFLNLSLSICLCLFASVYLALSTVTVHLPCLCPSVSVYLALSTVLSNCLRLSVFFTCLSPSLCIHLYLFTCLFTMYKYIYLCSPVSVHLSHSTCLCSPVSVHLSLSNCLCENNISRK